MKKVIIFPDADETNNKKLYEACDCDDVTWSPDDSMLKFSAYWRHS